MLKPTTRRLIAAFRQPKYSLVGSKPVVSRADRKRYAKSQRRLKSMRGTKYHRRLVIGDA